jgi:hypothetical protein
METVYIVGEDCLGLTVWECQHFRRVRKGGKVGASGHSPDLADDPFVADFGTAAYGSFPRCAAIAKISQAA